MSGCCCIFFGSIFTVFSVVCLSTFLIDNVLKRMDKWMLRNIISMYLSGVLYDRFNKVLMIALSSIMLSVFTGVTPWCKWFSLMMVATFMCGFGSGWLDAGITKLVVLTYLLISSVYHWWSGSLCISIYK